jgi:hypothetical protein
VRRFGKLGLIVGAGFTLPSFVIWSGCLLDTTGFGLPPSLDPGVGGSSSSTTASTVGSGGTSGVGGAGGQAAGSGGAGGQAAGSGGAGGVGGGVDAGCVGDKEICAPWWDATWKRRRRIQVDLANATALADFPVLVRLDSQRIDYAVTKPDGGDVRFVSEDGAVILSHEIEAWDAVASSYVWVRLPEVQPAANGPTVLWMYYRNPAAAAPAASESTWDSHFKSVHHFHADTNDSTAAANDGNSPNLPSPGPGIIAGARVFDGINDHLLLPDEADYDFTTTVSVSAWIRVQSFTTNWQAIVAKGDHSWRLHREGGSQTPGFGTTNPADQNDNFGSPVTVNDNTWHHVAGVYDGQTKKVFVDGMIASKPFTAAIKNSIHPVGIGENTEAVGRHFYGSIDEVRISSVARSDAWMRAEHRTVTADNTVTFGMEQSVP